MRKIFTFLCAALMSAGMYATTVTWDSNTLSSIYIYDGQSFTQDGVTVTSLLGMIYGETGQWMGNSNDASFKFSTSLGNFTRIEITGDIRELGGSGWTQTSPGAVWTGEANETTFGEYFPNVSQIVFTIGEPEPADPNREYLSLDPSAWSWGYNSVSGSVEGGLQTTIISDWGAVSTGWDPSRDLSEWDKIVFEVSHMDGCDGQWFKLKAYLRDESESEPNQMEGLLGLDAPDNQLNYLVIDLHQNKACDLTKARILAVQCEPTGGIFTISSVYLLKESAPAAKYYIVGSMNSWQVDENYEMNPSLEAETEEYFYTLDLTTTSEFKVVKVQNGQQSWIPEGMGNNYGQNGEITEDGEYTVYFRPNFDGGEDWFYSCIYAEKTGEFVPETPTYYLVGNMTEWDVDENYELNPNIDSDIEEYFYVLDLTTSSQFKVVKVQNGQQTWYPSGMDNNYGQNGEITEDGEYTVYFRPNYNGGEDWFYNCIYVTKNEPEPAGKSIVVFEANGNRKEVEVESFPHTFWCDLDNENGELDLIIQELYALPQGGYCDYFYDGPVATGNPAVTAGADEASNHFITISEAFEGTATVSGMYNKRTEMDEDLFTYTLTISIKGDEPTAIINTTAAPKAVKMIQNGQLFIEMNGTIYNVLGTVVR